MKGKRDRRRAEQALQAELAKLLSPEDYAQYRKQRAVLVSSRYISARVYRIQESGVVCCHDHGHHGYWIRIRNPRRNVSRDALLNHFANLVTCAHEDEDQLLDSCTDFTGTPLDSINGWYLYLHKCAEARRKGRSVYVPEYPSYVQYIEWYRAQEAPWYVKLRHAFFPPKGNLCFRQHVYV